ncbi:PQQ-binding-like beta-propeller repeat protein [Pontibacter cellulosilyticus]|uniref:PQQ-like beta-propeller repeat protein n=1 Tax=Pontibacter cellulosilyticus TaxID=1720253 RepID=A0A923N4N2_9BACT|nr:PQQ-binding-like beta-propeller repeat protein [Pontibacter cellulosilyticus]MBC5991396.1 PQQ-like beta-propeller repeat protein [Pontibacter cellulosilyticus]
MKRIFYALLFFLLYTYTSANAQELWSANSSGSVLQKDINIDGNILILKSGSLHCLSKSTGNEVWSTKIDKAKSFVRISKSTLIQVLSETDTFIINITDGKILYNSIEAKHASPRIRYSSNRLLVWASGSNLTEAILLDKVSGEVLSKTKIADGVAKELDTFLQPNGDFIVFSTFGVSYITASGKLNYNTPLKIAESAKQLAAYYTPTLKMFPTANPDHKAVIKDGYLLNLNIKTGQVNAETELASALVTFDNLDEQQVIIGGQIKKDLQLAVYDKSTCKEIRKGAIKVANTGSILRHQNDLFVISTSTVGGSTIKLVDFNTLALKADKTYKTGGQYLGTLFNSEKGIGVTSAYSINYFNPTSFESTGGTKHYIHSGKTNLEAGDDVYFFSNGYLGKVNKTKGEETLLYKDKLSVKLMEEEQPQLQLTEDGIIVVASQSVAKVDLNGNLVYNEHFAPPGPSAGSVLGNALLLAASSYLAVDAQEKSNASTSVSSKQYWTNEQKTFEAIGGEFGSKIRERFSKSANAMHYQVILTKGDAGNFKLIKFNKQTGKVDGELLVDSRTPDYVFDPVESTIYLFTADSIKAKKI